MYLSNNTIKEAIAELRGTANHMIKIWFVLKAMGLNDHTSVSIDTRNSTPFLKRLFDCGAPDGSFYVPFSHTQRFSFMKSDASRSIIQTTLQRWATSGSVVTCDPSSYLVFSSEEDNKLVVKTGRQYPLGLGHGKNGFAMEEGQRVIIPAEHFAVWLFAREEIGEATVTELVKRMKILLHLSEAEFKNIFVHSPITVELQEHPITDSDLYSLCWHAYDDAPDIREITETTEAYTRRVKNMITISDAPSWIHISPEKQLSLLIETGEKSILLYGPPRTGKTRAIDNVIGRHNTDRTTIQLHEGWGYDNLILGMFPDKQPGSFSWREGALLRAIRDGKKHIVLEEINRTNISQALGEVFSLIESAYRGSANAISLPNGDSIFIPEDVVIFMTMNTIDTSTEDIDDALIGRMSSVLFSPRVEDLDDILAANGVGQDTAEKVKEVFNAIQASYPLGHGYFASLLPDIDFKFYYLSRIRPVLSNHFSAYRPEVLTQIDNVVDSLFN